MGKILCMKLGVLNNRQFNYICVDLDTVEIMNSLYCKKNLLVLNLTKQNKFYFIYKTTIAGISISFFVCNSFYLYVLENLVRAAFSNLRYYIFLSLLVQNFCKEREYMESLLSYSIQNFNFQPQCS